jgi:UDP-N-acetylglucosamine:LPS N-acetylglucosamine transferase
LLPACNARYYSVVDASRWNKFKLIEQLIQVFRIILREKPDKIISTGASVGVWALIIGRCFGAKAVWIDSIANFDRISLSGRIVKPFVNYHLTQWKHLESKKTIFRGGVI